MNRMEWFPWVDFTAVVAFAFLAMLSACQQGPHARDARVAVHAAASALALADVIAADAYRASAERALSEASDIADYSRRMERLDRVEAALRYARVHVLLAQGALDARDAGGARASLACLSDALSQLHRDLEREGVTLPRELDAAARLVLLVAAGGRCDRGA